MLVRLRVREVAERYAVNRHRLGRKAGLSNPTMDKLWLHPENTAVGLETLARVAGALTEITGEWIKVADLIEESHLPKGNPTARRGDLDP